MNSSSSSPLPIQNEADETSSGRKDTESNEQQQHQQQQQPPNPQRRQKKRRRSQKKRRRGHQAKRNPNKEAPVDVDNAPGTATTPNKTLVIIMGNLRGGDACWNSLYKHVLDPNMADLALMIGETPVENRTSSMYDRAKYLWEFPEYDDWGDAIDTIGTSLDPNITWRDLARKNAGFSAVFGPSEPSPTGSGAINYMARYWIVQKLTKLKLLQKYTRFVITRADHYYPCHHIIDKLDPQYIWLPEGQNWGGFADRHLVLSDKNVLRALNIFPPLIQHPANYTNYFKPTFNPERMQRLVWTKSGLHKFVRRFPRSMFLVARVENEQSRWSKAQYCFESPPALVGTGFKYLYEYLDSDKTCSSRLSKHPDQSKLPPPMSLGPCHVRPIEQRTLVIVVGDILGGDVVWETMYSKLLFANDADLALLIEGDGDGNRTSSLFTMASKYLWEVPAASTTTTTNEKDDDDWSQAMDELWATTNTTTDHHHGNVSWRDLIPRTNSMNQYRTKWYLSQKIKHLLNNYTRFVITRANYFYSCLEVYDNRDPRYIWLPETRNNDTSSSGFDDRHMVLSKFNVLQALDIFSSVVKHPAKYRKPFATLSPEQFTQLLWKESGLEVRRFPRTNVMVSHPKDPNPLETEYCFENPARLKGVAIHSMDELLSSNQTCHGSGYSTRPVGNCSDIFLAIIES